MQEILGEWIDRLAGEAAGDVPREGDGLPRRDGRARTVRQAVPGLRPPVQRIVYAENEWNYCATCQTGGKLLADRALSRLLRGDWPKTLEELEERKKAPAPEARSGG